MRGQAHPPKSQPIFKGRRNAALFLHCGGHMTEKTIHAIEAVLAKGDTVQITPAPNGGIKVLRIKREIVYDTNKHRASSEMVGGKS